MPNHNYVNTCDSDTTPQSLGLMSFHILLAKYLTFQAIEFSHTSC